MNKIWLFGAAVMCKGISTVLIPGTEIGENCVLGLRFSTVRQFPYKEVPCLKNNVWVAQNRKNPPLPLA